MADHSEVICIGAGPAGLTAAYLLSQRGRSVTVFEQDPSAVGGISRTVDYKGFLVDIGGHRFFSKSSQVEELWTELLGADMLDRERKSRIVYRGKFFDYPLRAGNALAKLGPGTAIACVLSYLWARAFPYRDPANFEQWVINQFGRRLYSIFFRTYTEKVWGMRCAEISPDWAEQRINRLSLGAVIIDAFRRPKASGDRGEIIKSLIDRFRYPRFGPGMMWRVAADRTKAQGGRVLTGHRVVSLAYENTSRQWTVVVETEDGARATYRANHVISSMPLAGLFAMVRPTPDAAAAHAAASLRYRDFLIVGLIARDRSTFDDNWLYIHDDRVRVGRIQNFKSWSPEMVPDPSLVCYGMEYFCFDGDDLWASDDSDLIALARNEIVSLGLAQADDIIDGIVVRQPKAYPVYDDDYRDHVAVLKRSVAERYPNLHLVGRNGMHKYNNQDHAMMTSMLTVENIVHGREIYDVWRVNQDAEYLESGIAGEEKRLPAERAVPARVGQAPSSGWQHAGKV
jgi:protoporphyrinogen oxidase